MCQQLTSTKTSSPCKCQEEGRQQQQDPNSPTDHRLSSTRIVTPFIPPKSQPPTDHSTTESTPDFSINSGPSFDVTTNSSKAAIFNHIFQEIYSLLSLAVPMILTGLLLYSRSLVSMLFLGRLGELSLAGGTLAIGFANITGYSVLSGLAMGMEPICGQAFGANRTNLLGLTLQRTILLLLSVSIPIAVLWLNMRAILLLCGQGELISLYAQHYILYSLPDLVLQSFLHPLRIYLRTQSITMPLTYCAIFSLVLHLPINYLLVSVLHLGIRGVALAGVWTNFNLVAALLAYVYFSGVYTKTGGLKLTAESFKGWASLLNLAIPSSVSVCLEWWWYEIIILLCGLLVNPKARVASMGILIQTTSLIYIFPSSLSFGVSTRVGNELGANRPKKARTAALVGIGCSFVLGLTALTFATSVRNVWATMFTSDPEIMRLTAKALPIIGLCELGNCPQTTGCGVLRGSARPKVGANINLSSFYAVGMPVAVGLGFWAGMDFVGLWMGLLAAQATCVVTMLTVILRADWALQAERAQKLIGRATSDHDDGVCVKVDMVEHDDGKQQQQRQKQDGSHNLDEDSEKALLIGIKIEQRSTLVVS